MQSYALPERNELLKYETIWMNLKYAEQKKPGMLEYMLNDSIYMKL